mmetsp:Transcript_7253/g.24094  ORF Transcript_7253/g.24094 Transcript_7253/m.24094 type:complete len:215 (-) Transcript_7253:138-782(-)
MASYAPHSAGGVSSGSGSKHTPSTGNGGSIPAPARAAARFARIATPTIDAPARRASARGTSSSPERNVTNDGAETEAVPVSIAYAPQPSSDAARKSAKPPASDASSSTAKRATTARLLGWTPHASACASSAGATLAEPRASVRSEQNSDSADAKDSRRRRAAAASREEPAKEAAATPTPAAQRRAKSDTEEGEEGESAQRWIITPRRIIRTSII